MKRLGLPILPALVMAGTGLNTASALELGEIQIQSNLGQPLRASIAYALGPNEAIGEYCVSLAPGTLSNGMPNLSEAQIRVADGVISLTGRTPLREPLMSARLSISCPYTAHITRDYMFFLDPAEVPAETRFADSAPQTNAPAAQAPARSATVAAIPVARPERAPVTAPVEIGSTYRAQPGDTLSEIASRLEGRQVALWPAVMAIFEANPNAFIDNDPNQLKAGSLLEIPLSAAVGGVAESVPLATQTAASTTPAVDAPAETITSIDDTAYLEPASVYEPVIERTTTTPITADDAPQVGDITIDDIAEPAENNAEPATVESVESIDDIVTTIVEPAASTGEVVSAPTPAVAEPTAASPAEPATVARIESTTTTGSNYGVWWTLGGALALVIGIFAWRRRKSGGDAHAPLTVEARAPHPMRRITDDDSIEVRVIEGPEDISNIDFDLSDDSPTEENLALDADLFEGHGLTEAEESGNADFGFAETTDLDLELTAAATREPEDSGTDMIPPPERASTSSILESEVLPEDNDYDMSVIMDATKMPEPAEATERDLRAVVVHDSEKSLDDEGYTLSKEVDYEMLEQDYEDEMTATQALNLEIEKAAREIAADLDKTLESPAIANETSTNDETTALPIASVTELDVTASMQVGNDDVISDLEDTGINEALTFDLTAEATPIADQSNDQTAEMTAEMTAELTANLEAHEATEELEAVGDAEESDDATAEIEYKSGRAG